MKPIDTKTWKEFKISDLFETNNEKAYTGASVKRENLIPGETPRVTVSNINNGITGYYEDIEDTNYRVYTNFISVSFLGTVFYHQYSASVDMKVHVLPKLTNGRDLTTGIGLFLVSAIKASITRYTYANQTSSKVIYDTYIKLPVDQTGQPDWDYMEAFMEQINQQAQARLDEYKEGKLEYTTLDSKIGFTPVDTESWAEFKVGDLFEKISRGTRLKKANRITGDKPLLTAGGYNNGVSEYIEKHDVLYAGTNLTIDMFGNSFVHTYPFYADDNILIFNNKKYNENHLLFIKTALTYLKTQYGFQKQYRLNSVEKTVVKLPVDQTGQPDWNYMEAFMEQINQQAQTKLNQLEKGSI